MAIEQLLNSKMNCQGQRPAPARHCRPAAVIARHTQKARGSRGARPADLLVVPTRPPDPAP